MSATVAPAKELAYAQATADQTVTAGAGLTDITGLSITFTARHRPLTVEVWFPHIIIAGAGSAILMLYQDGTALAQSNRVTVSAGNQNVAYSLSRRLSLTAGTSYTFTAKSQATTVNHTLKAGTGAGALTMPAFIRAVEC